MTTAELLALLREAEWAVAYVAAGPNAPKDAKALRDRIYAALAQHEASIITSPKTDFLRGARPGICSYCGHPENSTTCQRGHP